MDRVSHICVVCGALPRVMDGVGDFAWILAQHLSRYYRVSIVLPAGGRILPQSPTLAVHLVTPGWSNRTSRELLAVVDRLDPDVLLVHFVPQLYGWRGTKPTFARAMCRLHDTGRRVVTVAHEFAAPFGPSPKGIALSAATHLLFWLIVRASERIVVTTQFVLDQLRHWYPEREPDIRLVPVGVTVPRVLLDAGGRSERRRKYGFSGGSIVVCTLWSGLEWTALALESLFHGLAAQVPEVRFLLAGRRSEILAARLFSNPVLRERTMATGPLVDAELSAVVGASDVYVALFPDGASTRRTSLMLGLAHGVPTVSNAGELTDAMLRHSDALCLLNKTADGRLEPTPTKLCLDARLRNELGGRGRSFYQQYLSWETITEKYRTILDEMLRP